MTRDWTPPTREEILASTYLQDPKRWLPDGKQCSDCAHWPKRCSRIWPEGDWATVCAWSPGRFEDVDLETTVEDGPPADLADDPSLGVL